MATREHVRIEHTETKEIQYLSAKGALNYTGIFFFSSRRRHTRSKRDWSSDVCSSDLSPATRSSSRVHAASCSARACAAHSTRSPGLRWLRSALVSRPSGADHPRQRHRERRAGPPAGAHGEHPAHLLDDLARDVQAEPGAADAAGHLGVEPIELLEDPCLLGGRDAEALVLDVDAHAVWPVDDAHLDLAPAGRVLDRVLDEVDDDLP